MKTIIINQTTGAPALTITTIAQTWGELQNELVNNNVSLSNVKAVVGETRITLESNSAVLPTGNFNLYLLPKKTKSGMAKLANPKTKDEIKESKPSKKAATKKAATKKVEEPVKKVASKKEVSKAVQKIKSVVETTELQVEEKVLTDSQMIVEILSTLEKIKAKNPKVITLLNASSILLEDAGYIIQTGAPRIDNLRTKKTLQELCNDSKIEGIKNM